MSEWLKISVVMITHNAESTIAEALHSIPQDAEIIVADAISNDQTVAIAQSFGAQVIKQDLSKIDAAAGNFDVARNQAMDQVKREWIFILDSDERLTQSLTTEISEVICNPSTYSGFDIPRKNLFWGKAVRLLGEDRQIRLIQRGSGFYTGTALHSQITLNGDVGHLMEPLIHNNINSCADVVRMFRRLPIERQNSTPEYNPYLILKHIYRMSKYYLFQQQAWRDGIKGVLVSFLYAIYHGLTMLPGKK